MRLIGGLGNQLFQYAFGRALAAHLGVELALDWSGYRWRDSRRRALQPFPVKMAPLSRTQVPLARRSRFGRWLGGNPLTLTVESGFAFDPAMLRLPDGVYVEGFFQSEQYFASIADTIRSELALPEQRDGRGRSTMEEIRSTPNAVSLHVRRGDYVTHERTSQAFGTCSVEYYARAADHVAAVAGAPPTLFVFSDDMEWAAANLRLPYLTRFVAGGNTRSPHEDLWLMSRCRHHIIANSSFSWWGAWLDPSREKVVVAPAVWFAGGGIDESTLVPREWARL